MTKIISQCVTLKYVFDEKYQFLIPSYQRPYVWSDDDVLQLFNDIKQAYLDGEKTYFIGNNIFPC